MADGLRNHEIAAALIENERALRSLGIAAHRAFAILEENARNVFQLTDRIAELERQVAQQRSTIETLVHLEQGRQDLRRDELNLERDRLELEHTGEVERADREAKTREKFIDAARDGARGFVAFLGTRAGWAVLFLCGMIVAWGMGTDRAQDLLSGLVALSKGLGVH